MQPLHVRLACALGLGLFVLLVSTNTSHSQQGPVGQGLSEAGKAVKRGFQSAGQAVSTSFQKTKTSVNNMEVVSRVYSRLHWDKMLVGSAMEIEVQAGGVVILSGVVPSEAAKNKALSLASETVGVLQVVDKLTFSADIKPAPVVPGVPPSSGPATTPTPTTTSRPRTGDTPL